MSTIKRGKAGEFIVIAQLLLRGFDCYIPVTDDGKIDIVTGDRLIRCQVKILSTGKNSRKREIAVRKVGVNSKSNIKVKYYTDKDIDFMVGVDLGTFDVFIVPVSISMKYKATISLVMLEKFRNRFDLLGPSVNQRKPSDSKPETECSNHSGPANLFEVA